MRSSSPAIAPMAARASCLTCLPTSTSSAVSTPREPSTNRRLPRRRTKGRPRKKGKRLPGMKPWAEDSNQPWMRLDFDQFGLHPSLAVKTIPALYYKAGRDRLLTLVLVRDLEGKRPDQMFSAPSSIGPLSKSSPPTRAAGPSNAPLKTASNSWVWRIRPIVFPRPSNAPRPGVDPLQLGGDFVPPDGSPLPSRSLPPLVPQEARAIVRRHVDDLRRVSYDEKTEGLLPKQCRLKTWIAQLTELLSRTGSVGLQPGIPACHSGSQGTRREEIHPPGRFPIRLEICETRT